MLSDLKVLVDLIRDAVSGVARIRDRRGRSAAILELLCIYFVLSDIVQDGRILLGSVGENPRTALSRVPAAEFASKIVDWDRLIRRQAHRLYALSGRLLGQDALAVIDPNVKTRLEELVGSKFQRTRNLAGVGSVLVMYSIFADPNDVDWQRRAILSMYPPRTRVTIDLTAANEELIQLSDALERFRLLCGQLAKQDEILALSKKARKLTQLPSVRPDGRPRRRDAPLSTDS